MVHVHNYSWPVSNLNENTFAHMDTFLHKPSVSHTYLCEKTRECKGNPCETPQKTVIYGHDLTGKLVVTGNHKAALLCHLVWWIKKFNWNIFIRARTLDPVMLAVSRKRSLLFFAVAIFVTIAIYDTWAPNYIAKQSIFQMRYWETKGGDKLLLQYYLWLHFFLFIHILRP